MDQSINRSIKQSINQSISHSAYHGTGPQGTKFPIVTILLLSCSFMGSYSWNRFTILQIESLFHILRQNRGNLKKEMHLQLPMKRNTGTSTYSTDSVRTVPKYVRYPHYSVSVSRIIRSPNASLLTSHGAIFKNFSPGVANWLFRNWSYNAINL